MTDDRKTVSIAEAARLTSLSVPTIYRRIADGTLETSKICGRVLVLVSSIDAMIEQGRVAA
jgi:excisionase family DNA binding protein